MMLPFALTSVLATSMTPWLDTVRAQGDELLARDPALKKTLATLRGVDPAQYANRRRPLPEVGRELRRAKLPAAVLVAVYARPERWTDSVKETLALREGVLVALGADGGPLAARILTWMSASAEEPLALRQTAAVMLGRTRDKAAPLALTALLTDSVPESLRMAALTGLASQPGAEALRAVERVIGSQRSIPERRAAIAALARLGRHLQDDRRVEVEGRLISVLVREPLLTESLLAAFGVMATHDLDKHLEQAMIGAPDATRSQLERARRRVSRVLARRSR